MACCIIFAVVVESRMAGCSLREWYDVIRSPNYRRFLDFFENRYSRSLSPRPPRAHPCCHPRYASISMAPLLARPGASSERWHVLSNPNDPAAPAEAIPPAASFPTPSAGTILLSLGFTPTGAGTPSTRPLSASLPGSASRTPRHFSADSPAASGSAIAGLSGGGGGDGLRRTPRRETPAIPEGFSLGKAAISTGRNGGSSTAGRAESPAAARHMVDARQPSMAFQLENAGGDSVPVGVSGANGDGGGGDKHTMLLPEVPESDGVEESAGGGDGVEMGSSGAGHHEEPEEAGAVEEEEEADDEGMVHLFRVKSYPAPAWCEICDRLLLGVSRLRATVGGGGGGGGERASVW